MRKTHWEAELRFEESERINVVDKGNSSNIRKKHGQENRGDAKEGRKSSLRSNQDM